MVRPTPFDLVFQSIAEETFPRIRAALEQGGHDPRDRDAFLMVREAVALVRELRPDEGMGEGIDQLAALVHHAYLFWDAGAAVLEIPADHADQLLGPDAPPAHRVTEPPRAYYAQLPERRVWAEVVPGEPPEPLDGCFVHLTAGGDLRVLGVFGLRPDRAGFSVVEAVGPRPARLARLDGSPLFSSTLPGGAAAGLHSLAGLEELLELGWRTHAAAGTVPAPARAAAGGPAVET